MSNLEKINVLTKDKLDSLDLTQYPNQIFGTTDEVAEGGGSEVVSYKNLAQIKNGTTTIKGVEITATDGTVVCKGTTTGYMVVSFLGSNGVQYASLWYEDAQISEGNSIYLKAGTYTISHSDDNGLVIVYGQLHTSVNNGGATKLQITNPHTITFDRDVYLCLLRYFGTNETVNITFSEIQIESGDTKTSFEPYVEQIADGEHVEVLYDLPNRKTSIGGRDFGSGIGGNTTITGLDLSKYQRLDIEYMTDVFCGRMSLGLTNEYVRTDGATVDYPYMTSSCVMSESHQSAYYYRVGVNSAKTTFASIDVGFTKIADATVNDRSNHSAYYIYKITGVLK